MPTQWPLVYAELLILLPTLQGWSGAVKVIDGPPVDDNTTSLYCTVGYATSVQGPAGTFQQSLALDGVSYVETGDVQCELVCQRDRNNLAKSRTDVFAALNALSAAIRADRRLGQVLSPDSSLDLITSTVAQQTASGPFMSLPFTITYSTTT